MSAALASWFGTTGHVSAARGCARAMIIRDELHQAGIDEIEKARRLVLEPSGKISIVRDSIPPEQHQAAIGETPHSCRVAPVAAVQHFDQPSQNLGFSA